MFGIKKKKTFLVPYDPEKQYPVIRASICNGEQVAGFKDKETGHFTDVVVIRNDTDLKEFKDYYGIIDISKEY